jgi:hypothetical protein
MLPPTRQRILILAAVTVSIVAWMLVRHWLASPDMTGGISLTATAAGLFGAMLAVLFAGAISTGAGLVAGSAGHPLACLFVVTMGLCVLAGWGGPIDGWMRRVDLPGAYAGLIIETLAWHVGLAAVVLVAWKGRPAVRRMLPGIVVDAGHDDVDMPDRPDVTAFMACGVAVVVGGVLCWALQRSTDEGQVIGTLIAAFTLAGLAAQSSFPDNRHVLPILLSPALVAIAAYVVAMASHRTEEAVLIAWFNLGGFNRHASPLPGPALVLPIYYASAGVAGATMGVGIAHTIHAARQHAKIAAQAGSTDS